MVELDRLYAVAGSRSPIRARRLAGRRFPSVHDKMIKVAHELGLRGPEHRFWTSKEERIHRGWLRWYDRFRTARGLGPLRAAADGLQEELEEQGFRRTVSACRGHIKEGWLRLHGLA
jgi:hypothetical protein